MQRSRGKKLYIYTFLYACSGSACAHKHTCYKSEAPSPRSNEDGNGRQQNQRAVHCQTSSMCISLAPGHISKFPPSRNPCLSPLKTQCLKRFYQLNYILKLLLRNEGGKQVWQYTMKTINCNSANSNRLWKHFISSMTNSGALKRSDWYMNGNGHHIIFPFTKSQSRTANGNWERTIGDINLRSKQSPTGWMLRLRTWFFLKSL